jgi:predicted transcriptional regulator
MNDIFTFRKSYQQALLSTIHGAKRRSTQVDSRLSRAFASGLVQLHNAVENVAALDMSQRMRVIFGPDPLAT